MEELIPVLWIDTAGGKDTAGLVNALEVMIEKVTVGQ